MHDDRPPHRYLVYLGLALAAAGCSAGSDREGYHPNPGADAGDGAVAGESGDGGSGGSGDGGEPLDGGDGTPDATEPGIDSGGEAGACDADSDGDGVCDADDACLAGDDALDTDSDSIPDACDCDQVGSSCDANAVCSADRSGATCSCTSGYTGDGESCEIVDCGSPTAPENGTADTPDGTEYGDSAIFGCDPAYTLQGDATRECGEDGSWSGATPTCRPVDCGAPAAPSGGSVSTPEGTGFGATATYSCDPDRTLMREAGRTCQQDETWSGPEPVCVPDCVLSLQLVEHHIGDQAYGVVNNPSGVCTADLTGVHLHFLDSDGSTDALSIDPIAPLAPGASVKIGESNDADYAMTLSATGARGGLLMLCAFEPCNAETLLDAVAWSGEQPAPALPAGSSFNTPVTGIDSSNQNSETFYRIGSRGSRPDFLACDWIASPAPPLFGENFECGDYQGWQVVDGASPAVDSALGANGSSYSLRDDDSQGDQFSCLFHTLSSLQPTSIRYFVRTSAAYQYSAFVSFNSDPVTPDGNVVMYTALWQSGYHWAHGISDVAYAANTWYKIELRNINYSDRTFDFWVDGSEARTGLEFYYSAAEGHIDRVDLYEFSTIATGYFDELIMY